MIRLRKRAGTLIAVSVVLLVTASCRSQNERLTTSATPTSDAVVASTPPFHTKEPERYRAVRTITAVNASGETLVTKTSVARDGEMRRHESGKMVYLDVPDGKLRQRATISLPRLRAAYVQVVLIYAAGLPPGAAPNVDFIARELQRQTDLVLGQRGAKLLIGAVVVN